MSWLLDLIFSRPNRDTLTLMTQSGQTVTLNGNEAENARKKLNIPTGSTDGTVVVSEEAWDKFGRSSFR